MGAVGKGPERGTARCGTLPATYLDSPGGIMLGTPWPIPGQGFACSGSDLSPAYGSKVLIGSRRVRQEGGPSRTQPSQRPFSGEVRMGAVGMGPERGTAWFGTLPASHHDSPGGIRVDGPRSISELSSGTPCGGNRDGWGGQGTRAGLCPPGGPPSSLVEQPGGASMDASGTGPVPLGLGTLRAVRADTPVVAGRAPPKHPTKVGRTPPLQPQQT